MDGRTRAQWDQWMVRLQDGDRSAFDPLFDSAWPILRGYCARFLGDPRLGEDAAQQALLKVFSRAAEFDPARPATPWILAIATNECRTLRNRSARRREEALPEVLVGNGTPEEDAEKSELAALMAEALAGLPAADAETLRLATLGELGDRPDIPAATFRKRVQRATDRLKDWWRIRHGRENL